MSENRYRRKTPFRQAKEEVLIVCGGQTEQIYFDTFKQMFRLSLGNISVITAVEAKHPMQIVQYALKARQRKEGYNAIWCAFDKDEFTDFDEAIDYAGKNGIGVAFSNQAFEVWFINHYRQLNTPLHRRKYKEMLSRFISLPYDKDQDTVQKVCNELMTEAKVKAAITNSRLGYEQHKILTKPSKPSAYESCTTVYKLAKSLLNWVE